MANFNLNDYVPVSERITKFYGDFPNGRINTELVSYDADLGEVLFKAFIYREKDDAEPSATGYASESKSGGNFVNKTSLIENCESSAVGRALAMLGYEIKRGIASREEMAKVQRMENTPNQQQNRQSYSQNKPNPASQPTTPPKQENAPKAQGNAKQTASKPQTTGEIVSRETLDHLISVCENPPKRKAPCDKNEVAKHYSNKRTDMLEDLLESEAMAAIKVIENLTDK